MPSYRRRQPRRFPAFRPDDPIVQLVWRDVDFDNETIVALNALAADTPCIGHSSSLTRCRFLTDCRTETGVLALRCVYPGRLAELRRLYHAGLRPNPGGSVSIPSSLPSAPARSVFADRVLVLEHIGGIMPDLRAAALLAKALRDVLMSGYKKSGNGAAIPATISGHAADASPSTEPHLAIAPLAFVGPRFADGRVLGFAMVPPGEGDLLDQEDFRDALWAVAPWNECQGRRVLKLACGGFDLTFTPSREKGLRSLEPAPYIDGAKIWATCTPIVLDRHPKAKGNTEREEEIAGLLRKACSNIGLPEPVRILAAKHSAVQGVPSSSPSGRAPAWTGWRVPKSLASRPLTHAVLQFDTPVRGPVILGAGRFVGLGLCRALDPTEQR
jgi:CRISPR-associated protein Csb2